MSGSRVNSGSLFFISTPAADTFVGGDSIDTVSYAQSTTPLIVDLPSEASWDGTVIDSLIDIENVIGSAFNDTLIGDKADNVLDGGAAGADQLSGGDGLDTLSHRSSSVGVVIDLATQQSWDGSFLDSFSNFERAIGSAFNDTIFGSNLFDNVLDGGAGGADVIKGSALRFDTVSYESHTTGQGVLIDLGVQRAWDGISHDVLTSIESAIGSKLDDTIYARFLAFSDNIRRDVYGYDFIRFITSYSENVLDGGDGGSDRLVGLGVRSRLGVGYIDTVSYGSSTSGHGVIIDLGAGLSWDGTSHDTLIGIDRAIGSMFDDTIFGSTLEANVLDGGDGGSDYLKGAESTIDTVVYASSTTGHGVIIDLDAQRTWDGTDEDTLGSIERAFGSKFDDALFGSTQFDNVLDGGDGGADFIKGASTRSDTVKYSNTSTTGVIVDLGAQLTWDGTDNDTLESIENAIGSEFGDALYGNASVNTLDGGAAGDTLLGGLGADKFRLVEGEAHGDVILDYSLSDGDTVELFGYISKKGFRLPWTRVDSTHFSIGDDTITFVNAPESVGMTYVL